MSLTSHRIRKLFSKLTHALQNGKSIPPRLPPELWIEIVSYIKDPSSLASLNRACHALRDITEPALYSSLDICVAFETTERPGLRFDMRKLKSLAWAVQVPRIAATVTECSVGFHPCENGHGEKVRSKALRRCTCDEKDDILGQILLPLWNLQVFMFSCTRCPTITQAHVYLENLSTENLRSMGYDCICHTSNILVTYRILSSPCMQSISTLEWSNSGQNSWWFTLYGGRIAKNERFLPNVTRIKCGDLDSIAPLAIRGTLTHVYCNDGSSMPRGYMAEGFSSLVHLRIDNLDLTISNMAINLTPYQNITHLGRFELSSGNKPLTLDKMEPFMKQLTYLPKLNSIELEQKHPREEDPDVSTADQISNERVLVRDIGEQLRMLRKIYILAFRTHPIKEEYRTWEKDQTWEVFTNSEYRPWTLWKED